MRSVDDIRRALLDHEDEAPDGTGLVEAARAGAVRVRRRRRLTVVASAVIVTLVAAASGVWMAASGVWMADDEPAVVATPPPPSHYRDPLQTTVEVDPSSGYAVLERQANRDRQAVRLRPPGNSPDVVVVVHNPGTFDPAPLVRDGEASTHGQVVHYYVPDLAMAETCVTTPIDCLAPAPGRQPTTIPVLGWQDPSGVWVTVYMLARPNRDDLLRAATAVRLGPPSDLRTPYRLGYLPPGFTGVFAAAAESSAWPVNSVLAVDPDPAVPTTGIDQLNGTQGSAPVALTIRVTPMTNYIESHIADLGPPTQVAGLNTYYLDESTAGWVVNPGSAVLVVSNGHCPVFVTVRVRDEVPYPELLRIVENATFTDCATPATWITPIA